MGEVGGGAQGDTQPRRVIIDLGGNGYSDETVTYTLPSEDAVALIDKNRTKLMASDLSDEGLLRLAKLYSDSSPFVDEEIGENLVCAAILAYGDRLSTSGTINELPGTTEALRG